MATLSPRTTTITGTPISTLPLKNNKKQSHLSLLRSNRTYHQSRKHVSCKANNNEHDNPQNKIDRRNILLGFGGLYGAAASTLGGSTPSTMAEPAVLDIKAKCERTVKSDASGTPGGVDCCPPVIDSTKVIEFDPSNYPNPATRVRPPAHKVDAKYLAKFQEAIAKMKALPDDDPLSWTQQANVHCAYCNGAYHQFGHNDQLLQVHFSWLFFPFHRCYLYFLERIVGKMINDPTFAIPYWNWDHPDGMRLPTIYTEGGFKNPLYDEYRNLAHQPPKVIDLSFGGTDHDTPDDAQIYYNLWHMYIHVVRPRKAELFMGGKYVAGDGEPNFAGSLELLPHNTVHNWTGDRNRDYGEDMGTFYSAARDPIFYGHHANVDRMWSIWKNLDGGRSNYDETDWLNTYFIFYDENRQPVKIYVRDVLNEERLGYRYQDVELPWLEPRKPVADGKPLAVPNTPAQTVKLPKALGDFFRTKIARPKKSRSKKDKRNKEEVLVVTVELGETAKFVKFDVYLNDEHNHESASGGVTKADISYAGSFTSLPHKPSASGKSTHSHGKKIKLKLAISEVIEDIGADGDDSVDVVFVARSGQEAVTITDVKIQYL